MLKTNYVRKCSFLLSFVLILVVAGTAQSETIVWKSGATGSWTDKANWIEAKLPQAGDEVQILDANARITLENSTLPLKNLELAGHLVFVGNKGLLKAESVIIRNGGSMTAPGPWKKNEQASRIHLQCSKQLVVEAGGHIRADGCGYAGGTGTAKGSDPTSAGSGPGAGGYPEAWGASAGGSYGGQGGTPSAKPAYGSAGEPTQAGSGGGGGKGTGGAGGGVIRIQASHVMLDGIISSNGGNGEKGMTWSGGGAGGSIWITCDSIKGSGQITANGGSGTVYAGGGGGGRVAVQFNKAAQQNIDTSQIIFSAIGGANGWGSYGVGNSANYGEPGTLSFTEGKVPGTVLLHTGVLAIDGQQPETPQAMTVSYWKPWQNNRPLVSVKKEMFLKHPRPKVAARVRRDYVGANLELRETRSIEILDDVGENIVNRWSNDNGRTWSKPKTMAASNNVDYQGVTVWEGGWIGAFDPTSGQFIGFFLRQIKLGSIYHNFSYWRLSEDQGRTWGDHHLFRYEEGAEFDPKNPISAEFLNHNEGYFGTNVLLHSSGVLIHCLAHTNAKGDPQNDTRPWRMGSVLMIGRWNPKTKTYDWKPGARVEISPELSARGLMEPFVEELADGRVLVVWRGSDKGWDGSVAKVPGHKWFSISDDVGQTLAPVSDWRYSDGTPMYSASSIHKMIRHSVTGKLYWVGNICSVPPNGNHPRYPLVIAEVDEEKAALKKETVTLIDDRDPNQHGLQFQLSNFSLFENRETHKLELFLTTYGQISGAANWATADCYHYEVNLETE